MHQDTQSSLCKSESCQWDSVPWPLEMLEQPGTSASIGFRCLATRFDLTWAAAGPGVTIVEGGLIGESHTISLKGLHCEVAAHYVCFELHILQCTLLRI